METIRKARKEHICSVCDKAINKGEFYVIHQSRAPKYKETNSEDDFSWISDIQIGIDYLKYKEHLPEVKCGIPESCRKGNHSKVDYFDADPESETCGKKFVFCENCGTEL